MPPVLLDTNVLVYAAYRGSRWHAVSAGLVDRGLRQRGLFCIAPQNLVEFASVVTRPRFVDPPLAPPEAGRIAALLYRSRNLGKIYPSRGTVIRAVREGAALGITGPAWYDLFLASTMRDAGIKTVVTENVADFRKFPFVSVQGLSDPGVADLV